MSDILETPAASTALLKGKRILVAKPGLDGHDVGAKVIALALRDAGAEVIYTGLRKSPGFIARVAVDEDVDAVGLSILSGSHKELVAESIAALAQEGASAIPVFVGAPFPRRMCRLCSSSASRRSSPPT
ncbi:cobalamin-dependent protein [Xanthobacter dioxanivorans]|uniref:cobalamin-dependent protein n=1 Tax=Xanthobacter dioxanivorans TaxID=2528964 RepID=UPI001E495BE7|nr:cobalamin-dependent protein [Xanthobacter dioxanivorans]